MKKTGNTNKEDEKEKEEFFKDVKNYLCQDIIENILSLVPLKPRTRFKCVSKRWRDIIDNLRRDGRRRPAISSGFLVYPIREDGVSNCLIASLHVAQDGKDLTSTQVDDISIPRYSPFLEDFCNGLLLISNGHPKLFLLDPFVDNRHDDGYTQNQSQSRRRILQLPTFSLFKPRLLRWPDCYQYGIYFKAAGSLSRECYNIICIELIHIVEYIKSGKIRYHVLSSDNPSEWTHHLATIRIPSDLELTDTTGTANFWSGNVRPCRHKGKMYWLYRKLAMVYDTEEDLFEIIKLPRQPSSCAVALHLRCNDGSRLLWGEESDGNLYYCESFVGGLSVWKYQNQHHQHAAAAADDDGNNNNNHSCGDWVYKQQISMAAREPESQYLLYEDVLCPLAFIEELQTLYLIDQFCTIFSYSFESQIFSVASSKYSLPHPVVGIYTEVAGYPFSQFNL